MIFNKNILATSIQTNKFVYLSTDQYHTHYWPFCNGTMKDVIGLADMMQGSYTSFTTDRFGNVNSSLALNGGWTQVPPGIYFDSSEFTISVWVYPSNVGSYSRIYDFGNGPFPDNIILSLSQLNSLKPCFESYSGSNNVFLTTSSNQITQNQWQLIAATFNGTHARIFLNGTFVAESNAQGYSQPIIVSRSNCYIGRSAWSQNEYSYSYLDDLRFYNKSLTQEEIIELMNYNQNETSEFSNKFVFLY